MSTGQSPFNPPIFPATPQPGEEFTPPEPASRPPPPPPGPSSGPPPPQLGPPIAGTNIRLPLPPRTSSPPTPPSPATSGPPPPISPMEHPEHALEFDFEPIAERPPLPPIPVLPDTKPPPQNTRPPPPSHIRPYPETRPHPDTRPHQDTKLHPDTRPNPVPIRPNPVPIRPILTHTPRPLRPQFPKRPTAPPPVVHSDKVLFGGAPLPKPTLDPTRLTNTSARPSVNTSYFHKKPGEGRGEFDFLNFD